MMENKDGALNTLSEPGSVKSAITGVAMKIMLATTPTLAKKGNKKIVISNEVRGEILCNAQSGHCIRFLTSVRNDRCF